jgi:hypothetical protein
MLRCRALKRDLTKSNPPFVPAQTRPCIAGCRSQMADDANLSRLSVHDLDEGTRQACDPGYDEDNVESLSHEPAHGSPIKEKY